MPCLLYKELKKQNKTRQPSHFNHPVSMCVFVLLIANMNGVDVKKPLVTKLFCYVVILKGAVSPKPRMRL